MSASPDARVPRREVKPSSFYLTKGVRLFAIGLASVALPLRLASEHVAPLLIGTVMMLALLSSAAQMLAAGWASRRFGPEAVAVAGSAVIACGGVIAALNVFWGIVALTALGALSSAARDAGVFLPLEQAALGGAQGAVHRMAIYNAAGTASLALGTLVGGLAPPIAAFSIYAACGVLLVWRYAVARFPEQVARGRGRRGGAGVSGRLAALFAVDAFAGGLIIQGFLAYWFVERYHSHPQAVGMLFAIANVLSALSLFVAARLGKRFGLLRTMVFTHLPSNVLLALVPFASTFPVAAALLLARYSLSQMDVPTRQAFVMAIVPEEDRVHAAGITSAVRPLAAVVSPMLSAVAMQMAVVGAPFFIAGAIKACYDVALYVTFRPFASRHLP